MAQPKEDNSEALFQEALPRELHPKDLWLQRDHLQDPAKELVDQMKPEFPSDRKSVV